MRQGVVDRDTPALRTADEMDVAIGEPVDHAVKIVDVTEQLVRRHGLPEAAPVVRDGEASLRQMIHRRAPHPPIRDTGMQA
jgi:hypothetical protein